MSHQVYSAPSSLKKLRACLSCHLIKTEEQFLKEGCENCKNFFNKNEITQHFKGMIAITNPRYSWCAKWLKKQNVIPGFYCLDIISNDDYEGSEGSGFIENDEEFEDEEDGANYEGEEGEGEEY